MADNIDQFCRRCGNPYTSGRKFCSHCGSYLSSETSPGTLGNLQDSPSERTPKSSQSDERDALPLSYAKVTSPELPPMLDRISLPGKWGRRITIGVSFIMTGDFATHAIMNILAGEKVASAWWVLATLAGCFLLSEKALVK